VHQLVNKDTENIKMHGTTVKKKKKSFNLFLVSLDPLISSLRKLSKKTTETYLPETLNLFAVPKELEDLNISDATDTEGGSNDTSEEITN
jgi:predicted P-loop ATPase/GTPase